MAFQPLYIGTYTLGSESEGIYRGQLDLETGQLHDLTCVARMDNPSFLCMSQDRGSLFAVSEVDTLAGRPSGAVAGFKVAADGSELVAINQQRTEGRAPCYVSVTDQQAFVANYIDGTVSAFPILKNGQLNPSSCVCQHSGSGPNKNRQDGPHAHSIQPIPHTSMVIAADLGTDEIITYAVEDGGKLNRRHTCHAAPGAGPRHLAFHPSEPWLFVLNELDNTLTLCCVDNASGVVTILGSESTLPDDISVDSIAADVHCSADGRYVYCTNRGHESIAVFTFEADGPSLKRTQIISCGGEHPRNFLLTPDSRFLLCANQNTHTIVTFAIDQATGHLTNTGITTSVPMPVCLCLG